jgi:hypothetical protein
MLWQRTNTAKWAAARWRCRQLDIRAALPTMRFHERRGSELDALKKISHENKFAKALKMNSD